MESNTNQPLLDVRHLSMQFTSKWRGHKSRVKAVDDVSFSIRKGETFGLGGESGCGKTTTGRAIIRLYDYQQGEVFFDGQPISGKMNGRLRRYITDHIAMIFQDPIASLNPRMTVEEIIGEGLKIRGMTDPAQRHQCVVDMLLKVGLSPEHATRYPHEFSGGQRQRIGIARALVVKPQIIVCDEAVSALDVSIQAQVINLLRDLQRDMNLTYLFISHDLSVVEHISDKVGVMYLGRLIEFGETENLFEKPLHPYTEALLSAVPVADPTVQNERIALKGEIPNPANTPSGCFFHTRCQYCTEKCKECTPEYRELEPGHFVACHRADELKLRGFTYDE